jgi:hypothetical protein
MVLLSSSAVSAPLDPDDHHDVSYTLLIYHNATATGGTVIGGKSAQ